MLNKDLKTLLAEAGRNPTLMQEVMMSKISELSNGQYNVVDVNNPFTLLAECATATCVAAIDETEATARRLYPELAQSYEEVYLHMADQDFKDVFSSPSRTTVELFIARDELLARAENVPNSVLRRATIPKDTVFMVNGLPLSITHPINIDITPHNSFNVLFDLSWKDEYFPLSSNYIDTSVVKLSADSAEYLRLTIPVHQFKVLTTTVPVSKSNGYTGKFPYTDQFYLARCYTDNPDGSWREINVTYNESVYDNKSATALLTVGDGVLKVIVPLIYFKSGLMGENLRLDLYTTRGKTDIAIEDFDSGAWTGAWEDRDNLDDGLYSNVIRSITSVTMVSTEPLSGGRDKLSFEELRRRAMRKSDSEGTEFDLETDVNDMGYSISRKYDNMSMRIYELTRPLDGPKDRTYFTNTGVRSDKLSFNFTDILTSGAKVKSKGDMVTLLPGTIYEASSGDLKVIDDAILNTPGSATTDQLLGKVNSGDYLFTPFHYVLDKSHDRFYNRCYYLQEPKILNRNFIAGNPTLGLDIGIQAHQIIMTDTGFKLAIQTRTSDAVKALDDSQVHVVLSFYPKTAIRRSYLKGVLQANYVDDERVYHFDLISDFIVDSEDYVFIKNLRETEIDPTEYGASLEQSMEIFFVLDGVGDGNTTRTAIDDEIPDWIAPASGYAVGHESLDVRLGHRLEPLEGRSLTHYKEIIYQTYPEDVPLLHTEPAYAETPEGYIDASLDGDGNVQSTIVANIGDPVIKDGEPVLEHKAGDFVLDAQGNKIMDEAASVVRTVDLVLLNAQYHFSTDELVQEYVRELSRNMVGYVEKDLPLIKNQTAPRTLLQLTPRTNIGLIDVTVSNNDIVRVKSNLEFTVDLYVTDTLHKDTASHADLRRYVREAISSVISNRTISTNDFETAIQNNTSDGVLGVHVEPLTTARLDVLTILDDNTQFSIGTELAAIRDGKLTPRDNITVNIIQHKKNA